MTTFNPLLSSQAQDFPAFDSIQPSHVVPAIDELLQQAETALEKVTANDFPSEWNAISLELDVSGERLNRAWGAVSHLNSVADNPELRAAYNEALPKISAFVAKISADERLYDLLLEPGAERAGYLIGGNGTDTVDYGYRGTAVTLTLDAAGTVTVTLASGDTWAASR